MPPFPAHLRMYLADTMAVDPMPPALLWEMGVTVLALGRVVQAAWREGAASDREAQEMEHALSARAAQLREGRTAC